MMRKDLKVGLAIGGILVAVTLVYALVGTGGKSKDGAGIVTEDTAVVTNTDKSAPAGSNDAAGANTEPGVVKVADAGTSAEKLPTDSAASKAPTDAVAANNSDLWDNALNQGRLLISKTPDGNTGKIDVPGGGVTAINYTPVNPGDAMPSKVDGMKTDADPVSALDHPATQPTDTKSEIAKPDTLRVAVPTDVPAGARTHVVARGETLVKIASIAYGNSSYFTAIKAANPTIDANKLRPGMTIILPDVATIKSTIKSSSKSSAHESTSSAADTTATKTSIVSNLPNGKKSVKEVILDPKSQYRVQSSDTLERIAIKLYGKREFAEKLYDLNKDSIGPDRNKLKLNMILNLPSAPTEAVS